MLIDLRDTAVLGQLNRAGDPCFMGWSKWKGAMADLDQTFAALADPTRRRILAMLLEDDMAVTDVAAPFDMSLAAISKHLAILTRAGLISRDRRGRVTWCRLEPDSLRDAAIWMQSFGQVEAINLDVLERFLDQEFGETASGEQPNKHDDDDDQPNHIDNPVHNAPS